MISITGKTFEAVTNAKGKVIVDIWSPSCTNCRIVGTLLTKLAGDGKEGVTFTKLNADENADLIESLGITSLPTVLVYVDGQQSQKIEGIASMETYTSL